MKLHFRDLETILPIILDYVRAPKYPLVSFKDLETCHNSRLNLVKGTFKGLASKIHKRSFRNNEVLTALKLQRDVIRRLNMSITSPVLFSNDSNGNLPNLFL